MSNLSKSEAPICQDRGPHQQLRKQTLRMLAEIPHGSGDGLQPPCNEVIEDGRRIPIVDCKLTLPNELSFRCPHCKEDHFHGAAGNGPRMKIGDNVGHRVAHCHVEESPFKTDGYYLRLVEIQKAPSRTKCPRSRAHPLESRILSIGQAREIVRTVAARDDQFFLASVTADKSSESRPLALCDSRTMTIAVPSCGVFAGSLATELALLHVRSPDDGGTKYRRRKAAIRKLVFSAVRKLQS